LIVHRALQHFSGILGISCTPNERNHERSTL
jgi:hypothetical protein